MVYLIDDSKIPGKDYAEYIIRCVKKEVVQEDSLLRQIFYTILSANTNNPINLGIIAPTSEGKTYPVTRTLKYVPKEDVWLVGGMSPKTLVRQRGVLVDESNEPLRPQLKDLDRQIVDAKDRHDKETAGKLKEQKEELIEKCRYLIKLSGTTLVFLEPPDHELWNMLKPILSHDNYYIEYPYVDKNDKEGIFVKRVVMQGYPACIFCTARDESYWHDWDQIVSRFLISSPTMNTLKYQQSNMLIAIKNGLPGCIQQDLVISDEEVELARECYEYVRDEMRQLTSITIASDIKRESNLIWIPYSDYLAEALPAEKGTDVRMTKRIFAFLNVVTLARSRSRMKLIMGIEQSPIADLTDLQEVLHMTYNLTGIPAYKLKFLKEDFLPLYNSKTKPDEKDGKVEKMKAVTSREICDYYKAKHKKSITTDTLKKTLCE